MCRPRSLKPGRVTITLGAQLHRLQLLFGEVEAARQKAHVLAFAQWGLANKSAWAMERASEPPSVMAFIVFVWLLRHSHFNNVIRPDFLVTTDT